MKFRLKLAILLSALITLTLGLSSYHVIQLVSARTTTQLGEKLKAVAITAAMGIDPQLHAQMLKDPKGEAGAAYLALKRILRKVRTANKQLGISEVYSLIPKDDGFIFGADGAEGKDHAVLRQPYDKAEEMAALQGALDGPTATDKVYQDQWGTWLTAYAPLRDANGDAYAVLGVDASAEMLGRMQSEIVRYFLVVSFLGVLAAFPVAWWLSYLLMRPVERMVLATQMLGKGDLDTRLEGISTDEFGELARAFNQMAEGLKKGLLVRSTLSRYVTAEVAEKLLESPESFSRPERRQATIIFTDLRGFTTLSESMDPEKLVEALNEHFEVLIEAIFDHGGTLDKFLGDGMMAIFGAPVVHSDDPDRAVKAALQIHQRMILLNAKRHARGEAPLKVGIGIHTGPVVAGSVGTSARLEYSVFGDTVNLASRLQAFAAGGEVVVSGSTYELVKDRFKFETLEPVKVKGKEKPVQIYVIRSGL